MIVNPKIKTYINGLVKEESGLLNGLKTKALEDHVPIIDDQVAQVLRQVIYLKRPEKILEVGTATGYSACLMALEMENIKIQTIERQAHRAQEARENFKALGLESRIDLIEADALEVLEDIQGPFDLVFVDGPKSHYKEIFDRVHNLIGPGGLIVCDNVLFRGWLVEDKKNYPRRKRTIVRQLGEFLPYIMNHPSYISTILTIGDGLSISIKR